MKNHRTNIPKQLHSDLSDDAFCNCVMCDIDLMASQVPYLIEKAFKRAPDGSLYTIFEFAICMDCAQKTQDQMSRESLAKIQEYFAERTNLIERNEAKFENEELDFESWVDECVLSNKRISECDEFQVLATCQGDQMDMGVFPYALSGDEAEKMQELLSAQTKDEMDDFMNRHLDLPPELKMLLRESNSVVLV
jgi:hypothetical protein